MSESDFVLIWFATLAPTWLCILVLCARVEKLEDFKRRRESREP